MRSTEDQAYFAVNLALPIVATGAVILRFVARKKQERAIEDHDWTIVVSLILTLGLCIGGLYVSATESFGVSVAEATPEQLAARYKYLWSDVIMTHVVFGLVKISILLLYKSIFIMARFRVAAFAMIAAVTVWALATILIHIFSSNPIDLFWTNQVLWAVNQSQKYTEFVVVTTSISMALDLAILVMPVFVIYHLQMSTTRKIQVTLIFGLGLFCCIASAFRVYWAWQLVLLSRFEVPITAYAAIVDGEEIWNHVEINTSIIAACLPTFAPLLKGNSRSGIFFATIKGLAHPLLSRRQTASESTTFGNLKDQEVKRTWDEPPNQGCHNEPYIEADVDLKIEDARLHDAVTVNKTSSSSYLSSSRGGREV